MESTARCELSGLRAPPEVNPAIADIGFVELYWADIPRRIQRRGYTIEETKAWARARDWFKDHGWHRLVALQPAILIA
jgi:hypothetical protein